MKALTEFVRKNSNRVVIAKMIKIRILLHATRPHAAYAIFRVSLKHCACTAQLKAKARGGVAISFEGTSQACELWAYSSTLMTRTESVSQSVLLFNLRTAADAAAWRRLVMPDWQARRQRRPALAVVVRQLHVSLHRIRCPAVEISYPQLP